jgi:aldehyde dehydrogenase (NAD+)
LVQGNWYSPTLIECESPEARIVQEETFGPVAVVMTARDFDHAMELCNGVDAGLIASLYSPDAALQQRFVDTAQAGILRVNPKSFPIYADAPFLGWKSSGLGPAEHGRWDLEFYSRPQAVYGHEPPPPGAVAPGNQS